LEGVPYKILTGLEPRTRSVILFIICIAMLFLVLAQTMPYLFFSVSWYEITGGGWHGQSRNYLYERVFINQKI
jgi:hypothetical protein